MNNQLQKKALGYFSSEFNCSQSVLRTILEEKEMYFDQATAIAAGFGGGIIGRGAVCGAVSGAIMALGVLLSEKFHENSKLKEAVGKYAKEFYQRFEEQFGDSTCSGLIADRSNPEAVEKAQSEGLYQEKCPKFVAEATKIIIDLSKEWEE
jgi:C_GCAxxG_C_C family probable redox protein